MRTPIIAANWKMNKTPDQAFAFVHKIRYALNYIRGVDKVICPPFMAIPAVYGVLKETSIAIGAQNMHYAEKGAYTGECAPNMLKPFCQYVILGHSERRAYFNESDADLNKKVKAALASDLIPIICVGESLEQNQAGQTKSFVSKQLREAFAGLSAELAAECIIAYEPVWAIGTGRSAGPTDAGQIINLAVRGTIKGLYDEFTAQKIRVQYGGSIDEQNIRDFMKQPDIDGALVGGASLKQSFVRLVENAVV